jgi:tRNA(His) 5'-end guanylyltransferase
MSIKEDEIALNMWESMYVNERVYTGKPIIARLDGRNFKGFTKKFKKPYDSSFRKLMAMSMLFLMREFNAHYGYTQSDEISLAWCYNNEQSMLFGGRVSKLNSILASGLTAYFNNKIRVGKPAMFDCRVFNVPDSLLIPYFNYRLQDCIRNSVSMAGRAYFSHKTLLNKKVLDIIEMLDAIGYRWGNCPNYFKYGVIGYRKPTKIITDAGEAIRNKLQVTTGPEEMYRRLQCLLTMNHNSSSF